jgi:hypothetical protein
MAPASTKIPRRYQDRWWNATEISRSRISYGFQSQTPFSVRYSWNIRNIRVFGSSRWGDLTKALESTDRMENRMFLAILSHSFLNPVSAMPTPDPPEFSLATIRGRGKRLRSENPLKAQEDLAYHISANHSLDQSPDVETKSQPLTLKWSMMNGCL